MRSLYPEQVVGVLDTALSMSNILVGAWEEKACDVSSYTTYVNSVLTETELPKKGTQPIFWDSKKVRFSSF